MNISGVGLLVLVGCTAFPCQSGPVENCAQPRLWYGPPGSQPPTVWGCRPPSAAYEVLPLGFLDPLDTGYVVVGNEVDWDVPWPITVGDTGSPRDTADGPTTAITGTTATTADTADTSDTGAPRPRRQGPQDTGDVDPEESTAVTGFTGFTGATGDTAVEEAVDEPELPTSPTADTVDTGAYLEPEPESPAPLNDPTDLVVPQPEFQDPTDLVVNPDGGE